MLTINYNLPSNPLKIKTQKISYTFSLFFNQRWGFFAPPPESNPRLYYTFYKNKNKKMLSIYEALNFITRNKREALPFNKKQEYIDYMINGSIDQIKKLIIKKRSIILVKKRGINIKRADSLARMEILKNIKKINSFKTLIHFAKRVKIHNQINKANYVKITITDKRIPKFINREKENLKMPEGLIFQTGYIEL